MKSSLTFMLAVFALALALVPAHGTPAAVPTCSSQSEAQAAPVTAPDLATVFQQAEQKPPTPRECAELCSLLDCMSGYTCGFYIDPAGKRACGCHL
jgi:hypothetical protein